MARKKLFGNNIEPSCDYCSFGIKNEDGALICLNGSVSDGACRKFEYDPLKREPYKTPLLGDFSPEDFML